MAKLSGVITGRKRLPPRMVVHAGPGLGKTTLGVNAPQSIFIPTEDGMIAFPDHPQFDTPKSYIEFMGLLRQLVEDEHDFKTVVIDTADSLEGLVRRHVVEQYNAGLKDSSKKIEAAEKIPYGIGAKTVEAIWIKILHALDVLRKERSVMPMLLVHTAVVKQTPPDIESYDKYSLAMRANTAALTTDWADCLMFIHEPTLIEETEGSFGKKDTKGVSTGVRYLYTLNKPAWLAKSRIEMPEQIKFPKENPWAVLAPYFNKKGKK